MIKKILFFIGALANFYVFATSNYSYNFEVIGKFGFKNHRHLGQAGALIPLQGSPTSLLYLPIFGMLDNRHAQEYNIGLGFRKLFNNAFIQGGYAFFDYRKSPSDRYYKQITLGYEFFSNYFEARANLYLPFNDSDKNIIPVSDSGFLVNYDGHKTTYKFTRDNTIITEKPSKGFDIECGLTIDRYSIYLSYYRFLNQTNTTNGIRARANLRVLPYMSVDAEINFDNKRSPIPFVGIKFNYPLKSHKRHITDKMTYLPVRDVDIVTSKRTQEHMYQDMEVSIEGWAPMVSPEILTNGAKHTPSIIFYNMNFLVLHAKTHKMPYSDITVVPYTNLLTRASDFGDNVNLVAEPGTVEYDVLTGIEHSYITGGNFRLTHAAPNSRLYVLFNTGFWTNKIEKDFIMSQLKYYQKKYPQYSVSKEQLDRAYDRGTMLASMNAALLYETRKNPDVYVLINNVDLYKHTVAKTIEEINKHLKNYDGQRYIVMQWPGGKHVRGLIVDTKAKKTIYMESNGIKMDQKQEEIIKAKWPDYDISEQFNPVKQAQTWSCGPHTFANILGYVNGHVKNDGNEYHRNVKAVFQLIKYSEHALLSTLS